MFTESATGRALFVAECDGDGGPDHYAGDLVVLDWHGGTTPLYPDEEFDALDLSVFETAEGGTLADDAELFKERVRLQIVRIFCDSHGTAVSVRHADETQEPAGTTIYLTQAASKIGRFQIGEGEYDPCNRQHDNAAVIFGEQIRRLGGTYTFGEWVLVFANVTAHEIAHTLGYGHITRDEQPKTERSIFVELMLDGHTMDELRREQRIIAEQTNCPNDSLANRRRIEYQPSATSYQLSTGR